MVVSFRLHLTGKNRLITWHRVPEVGPWEHIDSWVALHSVVFDQEMVICFAKIFKLLPCLPGSQLTENHNRNWRKDHKLA